MMEMNGVVVAEFGDIWSRVSVSLAVCYTRNNVSPSKGIKQQVGLLFSVSAS
jgi:hypothetical protein